MIIKEYRSIYIDKAEEVCNYVKKKIDNNWIDTGEIYVGDMVDYDEPIIIIPTFIEVADSNSRYADTDEVVINQIEFVLTADVESDKYSIVCVPDDWFGWNIDIAANTSLDTAIHKLNTFLSNLVDNLENYDLYIVD